MSVPRERAKQIQTLLKAAGYYSGEIDGKVGPLTMKGASILLDRRAGEAKTNPARWSASRRLVGASQLVLKHAGFSTGSIDGYWGNLTQGSYIEWEYQRRVGAPLSLDTRPVTPLPPRADIFPLQKDCPAFYGSPGAVLEKSLIMIDLPFPVRIDWNTAQTSKRAQLHPKCASSALVALNRILEHYGYEKIKELGLDRTAGTYSHRRMRGGSSWSMHAYGCAWDWYSGPNGLTTKAPQALFSKPQYKAWLDIWESVGWVSLGRAIGRDYMHVQAARL